MNTYFIIFLILAILIISNFFNKKENFKNNNLNIQTHFGGGNFGDSVNEVFWNKLTGKQIINDKESIHYLTTGSIMTNANNNSIIFGTGFISNDSDLGGNNFKSKSNKKKCIPQKIISVRGPLTRNKLIRMGLSCPKNYGDPLILFPSVYIPENLIIKNKIGIVPHYVDFDSKNVNTLIKSLKEKKYEIKKINIVVGDNYKKFIDEINECNTIISSSLHGVIMGLVYKKKTIHVNFSDKVRGNNFKFKDFYKSLGINYSIKNNFTHELLNNQIVLNYDKLIETGTKLIKICPFINIKRKKELLKKYNDYYKYLHT